jgi:hypothetical protein
VNRRPRQEVLGFDVGRRLADVHCTAR